MKILVVVDMQNDFISGSLGSEEAKNIVPNVVEKIKEYKNEIVIATYDTHDTNYLESYEGTKLPVEHCIRDTKGWELNENILNALNECKSIGKVFKTTFGYSNWVDKIVSFVDLKEVTQIELCGLCTDICVVSNALILRAIFPNIPIVVNSKCCAGVTPDRHKAALKVMESCQIDIV